MQGRPATQRVAHNRPTIRVTEVGEFVRYRSCERRFKLGFNERREAKQLPFAERLFNTLDPVLQETGRARENDWESSLSEAGLARVGHRSPHQGEGTSEATSWDDLRGSVKEVIPGQRAYAREVEVSADLGAFRVQGRVDFTLVLWDGGRPRLRIVECKASRKDRTYHRVQVALYGIIVRSLLAETPLQVGGTAIGPEDVECVVARIDESTNDSQSILQLEPLNLATETEDVERLLRPGGTLDRVAYSELGELSYQLDPKCDACVFNVHCLPESARARRLELLNLEPSTSRMIYRAGISTIDELATLDLTGPGAAKVRGTPGFTESLEVLKAKASARRNTLPGGRADPDSYEVEQLPNAGRGQLPEHEVEGERLIRVYMGVDYDYTENRVGALSAHITSSAWQVHTSFSKSQGRWQPDTGVTERAATGQGEDGRPTYEERPLEGVDVTHLKSSEWTGQLEQDTGAERELIQGFMLELIEAISEVSQSEEARIHLYVWSRSEMAQLVEACSRAGHGLLRHLNELLGCREGLEQMIYSCLQDEVDTRYALGWTGRGLAVATSLRWYGSRFHWRREVGGEEVDLDEAFTQDIFDFKTTLSLGPDGELKA